MFLITGCGRSGTQYMSRVLCAAGLDVGHERLGRDGVVSSIWAVEDTQYPSYHYQGPRPEFNVILHQVRNPLHAIASLTTGSQESWDWNARHIPIDANDPPLKRAAEYWYYWNLKCETLAIYRYKIERLAAEWHTLNQLIDIPGFLEQTSHIPTNTNHRSHPPASWVQVAEVTKLYAPIRDMTRRYGYAT